MCKTICETTDDAILHIFMGRIVQDWTEAEMEEIVIKEESWLSTMLSGGGDVLDPPEPKTTVTMYMDDHDDDQ